MTDNSSIGAFMPQAQSHYGNANSLRELADSLPRTFPNGNAARSELLKRLANEELAQAEYDDWVRTKVSAARADNRHGMSTEQLRAVLHRGHGARSTPKA